MQITLNTYQAELGNEKKTRESPGRDGRAWRLFQTEARTHARLPCGVLLLGFFQFLLPFLDHFLLQFPRHFLVVRELLGMLASTGGE